MSIILIDELRTTLSQDLILTERSNIIALRPQLYLHNDPAGTFTISIKEGSTTLSSSSLTMAEIKTNASFNDNEYHWGTFRFSLPVEVVLNKDVTYTIELSASGYSFAESSYIGWLKPYGALINTFLETVVSDFKNPFGYEIWGYKK